MRLVRFTMLSPLVPKRAEPSSGGAARGRARGFARLTAMVAAAAMTMTLPAGAAGQADAPRAAGTPIDGVREGKLANGLAYYIDPVKRPDGKILFKLLLPVGEELLPREQSVTHVVEHIVFAAAHVASLKGTTRARVERFGGVYGNDVNAAAVVDRSSYYVRVPAIEADALATGIGFLYDWMSPRELSDEEIDREIQAVIEERRRGSTDAALERTAAQLGAWFPGHPRYDFRPDPIGTLSATPAGVRRLHGRYYRPANMAVIIAGDVDPDAVLAAITVRLGVIPGGDPIVPAKAEALPVAGGHYVPIASDGPSESRIELTFKYRPAAAGSVERARQKAIGLIADRAAAPLLASLTERYSAPNLGVGLQSESPYPYPGVAILSLSSMVRSGETRDGLAELLRIAATLRRDGLGEGDIERARGEVTASLADLPDDRAGRIEQLYLDGAAQPAPQQIAAAAAKVSAAEVNAELARWLEPANRDIFVFHPRASAGTVPLAAQLAEIERAAERAPSLRLALPRPRAPAFVPFAPVKAAPVAGVPAGSGYMRWTLPRSGATLLYRRTDAATVNLVMLRPGGLARVDAAEAPLLALAAEVVDRSGVAALDAFEFGRFASAEDLSFVPRLTFDREGLSARAPAGQWPTLLQLARARILQPLCRAEAFEDVRQRRLDTDSIEAEYLEAAAFNAMMSKASGLPVTTLEPDRLKALRAEEICPLYAKVPGDTAHMVIVLEANLDPAAVYGAIASTLDLPRHGETATRATAARGAKTGGQGAAGDAAASTAKRNVFRIGSGKLARVELLSKWAPGPEERAGELVAIILGQRMAARLRTVEKGTYDANVSFAAQEAALSISFDTGPEKVERMIAAAKDELARLRRDGVTAEELATARGLVRDEPMAADAAADLWLRRGKLDVPPAASDAAVAAWIVRRIDPARLHEFIRLPEAAAGSD